MMRYIRAFFIALRMTLRGDGLPIRPYEALWQWIETGQEHVSQVYAAAKSANFNETQRKAIIMHIEGRDVSIEAILGAVQHHLKAEYPYLLRDVTTHSITGIYASNMNDQFLVDRLVETQLLPDGAVQDAVHRLRDHLNAIPPSNHL